MIVYDEPWEEIKRHFPRIMPEDYTRFLENEELAYTKDQSAWGKDLAEKNIGRHRLGYRGYDGKADKWQKRTRPTQRRASRTLGPSTRTRSSGHLSGPGIVKK